MVPDGKDSKAFGPTSPFLVAPRRLGERHRIVVWLGETARSWPLPETGQVIVGRAPEAGIQIPSSMVSRQHARFTLEAGVVRLRDLGSQNGTRVNGEKLTSERPLAYGDIVSFGDVTAAFIEDQDPVLASSVGGHGGSGGQGGIDRTIDLGDRTVLVADQAMLNVYTQIELLAPSDLSVLVLGETGTGKELAATALHFWSKRQAQPLVTINCASLPETLAESELFGYERGAFSGALQPKAGLLESAPGGTVFLDEIGDLSLAVQAKLLRVLEAHRLTRLGSVQERQVNIRVVAATHRDLTEEVKVGRFREDLYYRLSAAIVRLPPLRARKRELFVLARAFLDRARKSLGRPALAFSDAALDMLRTHEWPGNVRELKNLAEYLAATVTDPIVQPSHLEDRLAAQVSADAGTSAATGSGGSGGIPAATSGSGSGPVAATGPSLAAGGARGRATADFQPLAEANREFERERIANALVATGGNKTQAARLLGVPLRTFMEKVKRHGLG